MQNSESGRKINQAVNNTSRAVGGAISQAKGALSSWWSSITTAPANSTGGIASGSGAGSDSNQNHSLSHMEDSIDGGAGPSQQPQEISVTFQNHKDEAKLDVAGVSIHMASQLSEDSLEEAQESPQKSQGIVEIGREAELLDKVSQGEPATTATTATPAPAQTQSQSLRSGCGSDLALSNVASSTVDHNNGDVFIV